MKLKAYFLTLVGLMAAQSMMAQANILNAKIPEEIGLKTEAQLLLDNDRPLEYGYVDDRDILFSKMTWEKVVLDERVNFPLLYPIDTVNMSADRRSLWHVLMANIENGMIPKVYADEYFTTERTMEELEPSLKKAEILDAGIDYMNAEGITSIDDVPEEYIKRREIGAGDISAYLIKGLWYFDKRQGELRWRILGIAPAAPDVNFIDSDDEANKEPIGLFWVFYPEIRDILYEAKAFNNYNSAVPVSFDHLLNTRRFSGLMYKEENVYGDREVKDYIADNALMQLLESERIREKIRNFEQDMWSY
ncbi:type IX secretion system ring subunit PorN/GldN [Winogradskyella aurantiaca]|uniref:type IX secretion system ring protein PorN/GldN n=1 Tax=Winogradskyella aurantiaca TaxID=2219558 RepID=UPI000E1CD445|nr:gliding motility protein GldN [Winogradskyella aurantiaca]